MRALIRMLALATALGLSGCESLFGPGDRDPEPLKELPRALSASEQAVIGASNHFAFGLLRGVVEQDTASNVFLSPLSASMALGMTMNGARGETFSGMRSALGFGAMGPGEVNASYRSLLALLLGLDSSVDLRIANSIWVRQGFPLHDAFVASSREYFDASVTALDFSDPGAPKVINAWVERGTNGKIEEIVEQIDSDVMLYLINAVYFKGSWTTRFDRARTREAPFHRADGSEQRVRMMHLPQGKVRHLRTPEAEIVDLPYGRGAFSMTVVLPSRGRSLDALLASLDAERWNAWMEQLREGELDVFLPRFRLEYEQILNRTLQSLGMERAFAPGLADFSGMSPAGGGLFISQVKQKTYVDVNEEGTEAAAVTSVEIRLVSAPPSFVADRPFLVAIRERLSGTILFLGIIGAPPSE
jgi:serine protease inhibitor